MGKPKGKRDLAIVMPIAALSAAGYYFSLLVFVHQNLSGGVGTITQIVISFLLAAAWLYLFMLLALSISGLIGWLLMRKCRIYRGGLIVSLSSVSVALVFYSLIRFNKVEYLQSFWVVLVIFVALYEAWALLIREFGTIKD